jgi:hypothetical protein
MRRKQRSICRPRLEVLDNRWCPTCDVQFVAGTLYITGDAGNNEVMISDNGPGDLQVVCDGTPAHFEQPIERVVLRAGGGNDSAFVGAFAEGAIASRLWTLDLGAGDDDALMFVEGVIDAHISIRILGGAGADSISVQTAARIDADYRLSVDGGSGDDSVSNFQSGTVNGATGSMILGGSGDDVIGETYISVRVNGTFVGRVDAGNGVDRIDADLGRLVEFDPELPPVVSGFDVAVGARASYRMSGGNGHDALAVRHLGRVDGRLRIRADGGHGPDEIAGRVDVHALSTGRLAAEFFGGRGDDRMDVRLRFYETEPVEVAPEIVLEALTGFTDTPAPLIDRHVTADGGAGFDSCVHSPPVTLLDVEDDQPI